MMTASLSFEDATIPADLKALTQWVCWRAEPNGERIEKIPVCVSTRRNASSTDPRTWTTYARAAVAARTQEGLGLGFVFAQHTGIVGVDLDKCRDADTGVVDPWAEEIVRGLNSYTEVSPSGTGLHLFVRGTLPPGKRKKGQIETYEHARFFTVTGQHLSGTLRTIEDRTTELVAFHARYLADPQPAPRPTPANGAPRGPLSDEDILTNCRTAKNAAKFEALWGGEIAGYPSHSEADSALIGLLSFYTQDTGQLDRLFQRSGLMREKWNREDYRGRTIANVLTQVRETYTASPRPRVNAEPAPTQTGTGTDAPAPTTETQNQTLARLAREAELSRLAALSPADYGSARSAASDQLGIPVAFLDAERDARRKADKKAIPGQGAEITFEEISAAEDPVNGAALADRLSELFARFIVLPLYGERVLVLWVFFTYCYDAFEIAPRLDLRSPEKECGKTSLLGLLSRLVKRPLLSSGVTPPVIFRVISTYHPTLLIDEMDTFIDANEELRGILNSGHTKDAATIIRNVGDQHEPRMFSTWAPMAFAHIGPIPDTLEQRSIVLPMKRRKLSEHVASLRQVGPPARQHRAEFRLLVSQLERWVTDEGPHLAEAAPSIPDGLSGDRAADNWMPLLAIADVLGGTWPEQARKAALAFSGHAAMENDSIKVELLTDIRVLYARDDVDRLASSDLCGRLALLEERPWSEWKKGKPITPPQLARQLKPFHVSSRTVRFDGQGLSKGYLLEDFTDAFERYLPLPPQENPLFKRNKDTSRAQSGDDPLFQSVTEGACYVSENGLNPAPRAECVSVTARKGDFGMEETIEEDIDAH